MGPGERTAQNWGGWKEGLHPLGAAYCLLPVLSVWLGPSSLQPLYCLLPSAHQCPRVPGVKAKKPIQTKFRMPLLNWVALKPSQITGTVFTELNDEKVLQVSVALPCCQCGHQWALAQILLGTGCCYLQPSSQHTHPFYR